MATMAESYRSGDALFAYDMRMQIVLWNDEAARLMGVPAEEAVGRPCWDVLRAVDENGGIGIMIGGPDGPRVDPETMQAAQEACGGLIGPPGDGDTTSTQPEPSAALP